jgi:hypothetical protein
MEYIQLLRDTPLPTILTVGGIIFLLLSVLQKAGTQIETRPGKDAFAIITGVILLLSGVSLYLVPPTQPNNPTVAPLSPTSPLPQPSNADSSIATMSPNTTSITSPDCTSTPPAGLIQLWENVPYTWSAGIWGSSNVPSFMSGLGEINANDPEFDQFQIWIDPCLIESHGYANGAKFTSFTPGENRSFQIPLGGTTATIIAIPQGTGFWGLGPN